MVFILAFIGMFCWGIAPIFLKLGLKDTEPLVGLAIRTAFTVFFIFVWMLFDGSLAKIRFVPSSSMFLIAIEAILATLVGDLAYFAAIKYGAVPLVTIIMSSAPLITLACSAIFLNEQITLLRIIGAFLIVTGIVLAL